MFMRTEDIAESPVCSVIWHPRNPHEMLVGFDDGDAHVISILDQSDDVSLLFTLSNSN